MTAVQNIITSKSFTSTLTHGDNNIGQLFFNYYRIGKIVYLQTNGGSFKSQSSGTLRFKTPLQLSPEETISTTIIIVVAGTNTVARLNYLAAQIFEISSVEINSGEITFDNQGSLQIMSG